MLDLHNHMLPGLDDGARDWAESLEMARIAVEDGIRGVVCTPHWVYGYFENSREVVLRTVEGLRQRLKDHAIPLEVYPGTELRLDSEIPRRIEEGLLLTVNDGRRYALIELPDEIVPQNMENFFWELQSQNITPIIGHPERNRPMMRDPTRLQRWVEMGALVQMTAASLTGRFGTELRKFSYSLLEHHLVHIVATDAHGIESRVPRLSEGYQEVKKILGKEMARQMVNDTPLQIVRGEQVTPYDTIPFSAKGSRNSLVKKILSSLGLTRRRF